MRRRSAPALPAALEYVLEADKDRHPPRVRFLGTHSATYRGTFPMPQTRCESKELLLLVSVREGTRVHRRLLYAWRRSWGTGFGEMGRGVVGCGGSWEQQG